MAPPGPATDIASTAIGQQQRENAIEIDAEGQSCGLRAVDSRPPEDLSSSVGVEPLDSPPASRCQQFAPAVYQSSATLLSSLIFPPYEFVHCDLDDDPDDCQITGEYQQSDEFSSSSSGDENVQNDLE